MLKKKDTKIPNSMSEMVCC